MTELTLIAEITAKPGKEAEVEGVLRGLLVPTRAEDGCVAYNLHLDNENAAHFVLTETWATVPLWQTHMTSPHLTEFQSRTDELVAEWRLVQLTRLD